MKFHLTINMDNAAFGENASDRATEVARILSTVVTKYVEADRCLSPPFLRDLNGNTVGMAAVELEPDDEDEDVDDEDDDEESA